MVCHDVTDVLQLIGTNLRGEMTVQQAETVQLSIIGKLAKTMKISSEDVSTCSCSL